MSEAVAAASDAAAVDAADGGKAGNVSAERMLDTIVRLRAVVTKLRQRLEQTAQQLAERKTQLDECRKQCEHQEAELQQVRRSAEEREGVIQRLRTAAQQGLDASKRELAEQAATIRRLEQSLAEARAASALAAPSAAAGQRGAGAPRRDRAPLAVVRRFREAEREWCLVRYQRRALDDEAEDDGAAAEEFLEWATPNELARELRLSGRQALPMPPVMTSDEDRATSEKQLRAAAERAQEEYRRYRVRSEIAIRQKEAEIAQLRSQLMRSHMRRISDTPTGSLSSPALAAEAGAEGAAGHAGEEGAAVAWRDTCNELLEQVQQLKQAVQRAEADSAQWRTKFEQLKGNSSAEGDSAERDARRYQQLAAEYQEYRRRASQVVEEREAELRAAEERMGRLRMRFERLCPGEPLESPREGEAGGARFSAAARLEAAAAKERELMQRQEYLKNVLLQYMTTEDAQVRARMETALAAVVKFSPEEVQLVKERRRRGGVAGWGLW